MNCSTLVRGSILRFYREERIIKIPENMILNACEINPEIAIILNFCILLLAKQGVLHLKEDVMKKTDSCIDYCLCIPANSLRRGLIGTANSNLGTPYCYSSPNTYVNT